MTHARRFGVALAVYMILLSAAVGAQEPVTALVDVNVIPMDRERILPHQTVLVQGDRVTAVGPSAQVRVPAGATRIAGAGKWLIPGLGDMHVHLPTTDTTLPSPATERALLLFLAQGVTTVRNMDGRPLHLQIRSEVAQGKLLGPRIYTAGPIWGRLGNGVPTPATAVQAAMAQHAAGYDFLKIYNGNYTREALDSLVATANRLGMPYAGHPPTVPGGLAFALQTHFASVEHLFYGYGDSLLRARGYDPWELFSRPLGEFWVRLGEVDQSQFDTLAAAARRAGVWNVPTAALVVRLMPKARTFLSKMIKALHAAGAGILLGTDGDSDEKVVFELRELVAAGLTPYQALETGTRNVAAFFGALDTTGTIAVGKRADLVLLAENPLEDVGRVAQPVGVIVGGRWLSSSDIEARLIRYERPRARVKGSHE